MQEEDVHLPGWFLRSSRSHWAWPRAMAALSHQSRKRWYSILGLLSLSRPHSTAWAQSLEIPPLLRKKFILVPPSLGSPLLASSKIQDKCQLSIKILNTLWRTLPWISFSSKKIDRNPFTDARKGELFPSLCYLSPFHIFLVQSYFFLRPLIL